MFAQGWPFVQSHNAPAGEPLAKSDQDLLQRGKLMTNRLILLGALLAPAVALAQAHFDVELADLQLRRAAGEFPGHPVMRARLP